MPISINKPVDTKKQATTVKTYDPKFFDCKLTGVGKTIGVLSSQQNPANVPANRQGRRDYYKCTKSKFSNGNTETTYIPTYIFSMDAWEYLVNHRHPKLTDMVKIGTYQVQAGTSHASTMTLYMEMKLHSICIEETKKADGSASSKSIIPCYQVLYYNVDSNAKSDICRQVDYISSICTNNHENLFYQELTVNPLVACRNHRDEIDKTCHIKVDTAAQEQYLNNFSVYTACVERSAEWQTALDKDLDEFFENVNQTATYRQSALNELVQTLRYIETYNVPLDLYRKIYQNLKNHFSPFEVTTLCKQNLNLLLSDTMNNLNQNKASLQHIQPTNPATPIDPMFSKEQVNAITATDPLVLVQAGAGTGKSTVILGRIDWMIANGVKPEDITVLSFTNAAADHITEKNPNVHSMTIARMIHTIYSANFPNHRLSQNDTIINTLNIHYPHPNSFISKFKKKLRELLLNKKDAFTNMNNFIEYHYDEVMTTLDTIKQTSLELEIMICYQQIENLSEPAEVLSRYLIIDEVQDNSIFEFIYTLKCVEKHKESLFIVGDCSQTLYEFRASNPKALNVMEGSGVFTTYQLQTNYRSRQEILDFANVALKNIEANQYAHIQLRANSLIPTTEKSFTDAVQLNYQRIARVKDFRDNLGTIFASNIKPYIDDKFAKNEQVCVLAYTRDHVKRIKETLEHMYPNRSIVSIVPEKMYSTTVFSAFVGKYRDDIKFIPSENIMTTISNIILAKAPYLVKNTTKGSAIIAKALQTWCLQDGKKIDEWQTMYKNRQITLDEFLKLVTDDMVDFEVRTNSVRQSVLSAKNEETKNKQNVAKADVVLSTIHSAKGLEFEHAVIVYRDDSNMSEPDKRMYYVAFTRPMKSEYILAYDTKAKSKIQADYNTIVKALKTKDLAIAQKNKASALASATANNEAACTSSNEDAPNGSDPS